MVVGQDHDVGGVSGDQTGPLRVASGELPSILSKPGMERRLTAILAADVVGYSRLMGADETDTFNRLKEARNELVSSHVVRHQGRVVKLTGDGMLLEFSSVISAVACAVELQRSMRAWNDKQPDARRLEFRIGVNLGDVIVEDDDNARGNGFPAPLPLTRTIPLLFTTSPAVLPSCATTTRLLPCWNVPSPAVAPNS